MCGDLVSNHGTTGRASIERAEARPSSAPSSSLRLEPCRCWCGAATNPTHWTRRSPSPAPPRLNRPTDRPPPPPPPPPSAPSLTTSSFVYSSSSSVASCSSSYYYNRYYRCCCCYCRCYYYTLYYHCGYYYYYYYCHVAAVTPLPPSACHPLLPTPRCSPSPPPTTTASRSLASRPSKPSPAHHSPRATAKAMHTHTHAPNTSRLLVLVIGVVRAFRSNPQPRPILMPSSSVKTLRGRL